MSQFMTQYQLKRSYEPASPEDGFRVYIDRLWPRGLSHETFHYDLWDKDIAPSTELREWFHADPDNRWSEFETRYSKELETSPSFGALRPSGMKGGSMPRFFDSPSSSFFRSMAFVI